MQREVENVIGIKNMALPSDCSECPVAVINDGFKCMLTDKKFYHILNGRRQEWCPLIEVECMRTNPEDSYREGFEK